MKKRKLGQSDLLVSEMGLGCMSLGTDEKKAESIIQTALECGITYFDTADLYDFGLNEQLVGSSLKPVREKVVIATKVGNRWNKKKDSWTWDASKAYIQEEVKSSLKRLNTDYIDLYQLHGGTMEDNHDEIIDTFEELVKQGYIKHYGISSIRPNVIKTFLDKSSLVSVMMQYSLLDRRPEEWMEALSQKGVSIIARGPVAKGMLSDKMLKKANENIQENGYLDYSYQELEDVLNKLKEAFAAKSLQEVALQYVLAHPVVGAVIPGASSPEQVISNVKAVEASPLSDRELDILKSLTKQNKYSAHRS
ncbi:aldo/keto reductase [Bacillus testis]|uniref:aldo/keto reductase n=1 Tax=Bacillus testis TaxID=1622072 RepID=UPI00067ED319|nr:aldo/keto reductase [Bacillus testis]